MKGTDTVPFLFVPMATAEQIQFVEEAVKEILSDDPSYFLVQVKVKPTNNFKVFLDGDQGITIEKCIKVNRALYKRIEEQQFFPEGDFSLEVSSPGVGEPLLLHRQYVKNIGRTVAVKLNDGTETEGELKEVTGDLVVIVTTTGKGKKAIVADQAIPFGDIRSMAVQIKF